MLYTNALYKFYLIVIQINCDDGGIKLLLLLLLWNIGMWEGISFGWLHAYFSRKILKEYIKKQR